MVDLGCSYNFPAMMDSLPEGVEETLSHSRKEEVISYLKAAMYHISNNLGLFSKPNGSLQPTNVTITIMENYIGKDFLPPIQCKLVTQTMMKMVNMLCSSLLPSLTFN